MDGLPQFKGLKLTQDPKMEVLRRKWGVRRVLVDRGSDKLLVGQLGKIGWGGNSGFQALNLTVQFGVRKIILVGYDMRVDGQLHWHPDHGRGMNNPTAKNVERWRRVTDEAWEILKALEVEVVNVSKITALSRYPVVSWENAIEDLRRVSDKKSARRKAVRRIVGGRREEMAPAQGG